MSREISRRPDGVEAVERLVEDQDVRVVDEGLRQLRALPHALR